MSFQVIIQHLLLTSLLQGFSALIPSVYSNLAVVSFTALQFLQQFQFCVLSHLDGELLRARTDTGLDSREHC